MKNDNKQQTKINRLVQMEHFFDTLLLHDPDSIRNDPTLTRMLHCLTAYYEGGQWLEDYLSDERGELPAGLKRGVLSQDGVYDLLSRLEESDILIDNSNPS